jgi:hypothetical protein
MKISLTLATLIERSQTFHPVIKSLRIRPDKLKVSLLASVKKRRTNMRTVRTYVSLHWLACGSKSRTAKITATDSSSSNTRSWWWSVTVTNIRGRDSKTSFCTCRSFYSNRKMVKICTSSTTKTMMLKIPPIRFSSRLLTLIPPATLRQSNYKRTRVVFLRYQANSVARSWLELPKT